MYKGPFKWWVQSVMPTVFDDSLSYYEVLAKLTKYIEGLTGDVKEIEKVLETIEGIEDITEFTKFLETIQAEIGNLNNLQTVNKSDLVSAINEIALKANNAYIKPSGGIPESDLSQNVQDKLNRTGDITKYIINNRELKAAPSNNSPADLGLGTYSVPAGGIPWDTLSQDVQDRINAGGGGTGGTTDYTDLNNKPQINGHTLNAGNNTAENLGIGTYSKPSGGIPESDLSTEVQEKLNTSGGIAGSETSFVATRDYEAGELIYINGVLYKTKYKILNGTNLIPGNNIEVTDISAEIERINNEIDALQSGSGPDSWTLSTNIQNPISTLPKRFFEYFNCIGNESYLFIITPIQPLTNGSYYVYIRKKDGSEAHRVRYDAEYNEGQHRFTFVPTDTGEYYCEFVSQSDYNNGNYRIEIEYTESQGISELWAQVNQSSQLEPRVSALETLVGEQQAQLEELNNIPEKVETLETDVDNLKSALQSTSDIAFSGGFHVESAEQGAAYAGSISHTETTRIMTAPIPVSKGMRIKINPGIAAMYCYVMFSESIANWSGTEISPMLKTSRIVDITDTGYVIITFRKGDASATISPSEYDASVEILPVKTKSNLASINRTLDLNNYIRPVGNGNIDRTQGVIISPSLTTRLVTNIIPVFAGDVVDIKLPSNLRFSYFLWVGEAVEGNISEQDTGFNLISKTINIINDGYIAIAFAKSNSSAAIALSDYNGTVSITRRIIDEILTASKNGILATGKYCYNGALATIRKKYVANDGVTEVANNNVNCSDYIDISNVAGTYSWLKSYTIALYSILFYDENRAFLYGDVYDPRDTEYYNTVFIPTNARYARFNIGNSKQMLWITEKPIQSIAPCNEISQGRLVQVNDGMTETAASAVESVIDTKTGIVYAVYLAGNREYGEQVGWIRMAIFPAGQPHNATWVTIAEGYRVTEPNILQVDDNTIRVLYRDTTTYYYKDYTISTKTLSNAVTMLFGQSDFTWSAIDSYLSGQGYSGYQAASGGYGCIFTSRIFDDGEYKYGAITGASYYPVLVRSNDNFATLEPIGIYPVLCNYEFTFIIDGVNIQALARNDSTGIAYAVSSDGGQNWTSTIIPNTVGSRPDLFNYGDDTYVAYNYNAGYNENGFPVNSIRNAIILGIIEDGEIKEIANFINYHGIVYERIHYFFNDAYMIFSQSTIGLEAINSGTGHFEESKEVVAWVKIIENGQPVS